MANLSTDEWDDTTLVDLVRRGDEAACAQLVRQFGGRMLAVTRRLMRDEEDARDALQDAFASAFRAIQDFDGRSKLATWLHTIAANAALIRHRRARSRPERSIEELLPRFIEDGHHAADVPDWSQNAMELAEREETRRQIRAAIDQLPDSYRTVLLARDIEGLDTEQTARALGLAEGAVKTRLHRARLALRQLLEAILEGDYP
jgi:RNA polymerase sigma-70 factor (ECF subfamily)